MPSGSYIQSAVLCPFFITDTEVRFGISCEGITDRNRLCLKFYNNKDKIDYMKMYCTKNYYSCCLYKTINNKYDLLN